MNTRAQMPPKSPPATIGFFVGDEKGLRVTGVFDVFVPIAQRRNPDQVSLEADITTAIRGVLEKYANDDRRGQ
jgi:hypothetical protein